MYNKDLHNKFTKVVKSLKVSNPEQLDILNALVDLLNRKEFTSAGEIWGEYVDQKIKDEIRDKIENIDELFEAISIPKTVKELFELRSKLNGEIDFRTRVGNQTKKFIRNMRIRDTEEDILDQSPEEKKKLTEKAIRRVDSDGNVSKQNDVDTAKRRAANGSSQSKGERERVGQAAARTREKNPSIVRKAQEKRKKAMELRKQRGIQ